MNNLNFRCVKNKLMLSTIFVVALFLNPLSNNARKEYEVACVGFYNLENLFDTIVDPDTNKILQEDFTPIGSTKWNTEKYIEKLGNMSKVISDMGIESTPDGPAVLGVAEIENKQVLEDLVKEKSIASRDYKIVHY